MVYMVAYDVADGARLRAVAAVCEDFGCRLEKSFFRCTLSEERFRCFQERLLRILSPARDRLIVIPLCERCAARVRLYGPIRAPDTAAPALVF